MDPDSQRLGDDQPQPGRDSFRLSGLTLDRAHEVLSSNPAIEIGPGNGHPRARAGRELELIKGNNF